MIRIIECDGIGAVYPSGLIKPKSGLAPSKTFIFPRQKKLPERIRILWKVESDEFAQDIEFPKVEKGSDGMLRLELSKDNVWSLTFEKESPKKK